MKRVFCSLMILVQLTGCSTLVTSAQLKSGEDFININPGMSRGEVISVMGNPDSFRTVDGTEVLQWIQRPTRQLGFIEAFSKFDNGTSDERRRGDYYVVIRGGVVAEKGTGNITNDPTINIKVMGGLKIK